MTSFRPDAAAIGAHSLPPVVGGAVGGWGGTPPSGKALTGEIAAGAPRAGIGALVYTAPGGRS